MKKFIILLGILFAGTSILQAQGLKNIKLVEPNLKSGKTVLQAMKDRKSTRVFADKELSIQHLSELLWAANGITRPDGRRTAPSAKNIQDIDVYAITKNGAYKYNAQAHELEQIVAGDYRKDAGSQDFVSAAPVNLIYVADASKGGKDMTYAYMDVGFVAENVYLYCSAADLACVVRAWVDKDVLANLLKLTPNQKVLLGHTVGYQK